MKNFSKTLLVIMIGTMGISSCADSWEEMRKEKYEKEWVKTFGEVDPNHTWNLATQVTADLAIKEDALTEYTFKVYTSDPIWGTDAKLLAKATVKTDEVGYAETQIKFDAPSSQERYYITRTDSHGRRLLKVSDIENKKIGVKFGISNYSAESRALHNDASFESLKIDISPYTENYFIENLPNIEEVNEDTDIANGGTAKVTSLLPKTQSRVFKYNGKDASNKSTLIIAGEDIILADEVPNNEESCKDLIKLTNIDLIIAPNATLTLERGIRIGENARIIVMKGGTLNAFPGYYSAEFDKISINIENSSALLYNAGTFNIDYLRIESGLIYNAETGVLPGNGDPTEETKRSIISMKDDNGTITNFGKMKLNRLVGTHDVINDDNAGHNKGTIQGTLNNGCYINIKERIYIKYLNIAANSSLESHKIGTGYITMRENSIIRSDLFSSNSYGADKSWIYKGAEGGKALISCTQTNYLGGINVSGPIYYETNQFKDQNNDTSYDYNNPQNNYFYTVLTGAYQNNTSASCGVVGSCPFLIIPDHNYNGNDVSKYDCVGHGNIPQEFQTIIDKNIEWAIAFEDLGDIGDYDFNDVVIGVSQDGNKIKVTALAAGGTLPADVYYKGENLGEIHELLNRAGDYSPINVKNKRNEESGKRKIYEIDPDDFSIEKNWTDFTIQVNGKASATITPNETVGNVPQALCIPSDWLWPKESINIHDAYADFTNWVKDQDSYKTWYEKHTDGKVAVNQ